MQPASCGRMARGLKLLVRDPHDIFDAPQFSRTRVHTRWHIEWSYMHPPLIDIPTCLPLLEAKSTCRVYSRRPGLQYQEEVLEESSYVAPLRGTKYFSGDNENSCSWRTNEPSFAKIPVASNCELPSSIAFQHTSHHQTIINSTTRQPPQAVAAEADPPRASPGHSYRMAADVERVLAIRSDV
ncbi:hypothetical protein GQ600_23644 [Phytophthora cactorum]|nr:hypothetical protein GQ600_23644 [Phytophthora cactorum]